MGYTTVVETPLFARAAAQAGMDDDDKERLIDLLATDPEAGVSLGSGLYKVRLARQGGGKSGGFRIVYFFREEDLPIFLLTAFAKNQKSNITAAERDDLIRSCRTMVEDYRSRQ